MSRIIIEMQKQKNADYSFLAKDAEGNQVDFNPSEIIGDHNIQEKPTQVVLMALGSSSGVDVMSWLNQQEQIIDDFRISVGAFRTGGMWRYVSIAYDLRGLVENVKAREACLVSLRKHCMVVKMLKRAGACLEWQLRVNNCSFTHIIEPPINSSVE